MKGSALAPEDCNTVLDMESVEAWQLLFFGLLELVLTSHASPAWQTAGVEANHWNRGMKAGI